MRRLGWALAACVLATGCRHKPARVVAIQLAPVAPVPIERAPEPATPPMVQSVPVAPPLVTAVTLPPKRVKRKKKIVAPPAPVQIAGTGAPVPAADVVGALTAGDQGSPEMQRKASDLLGVLEKRVAGLSAAVLDAQKEQVARVKYFWGEAHGALVAGDADGAWNLATKAKLLLDDLVK